VKGKTSFFPVSKKGKQKASQREGKPTPARQVCDVETISQRWGHRRESKDGKAARKPLPRTTNGEHPVKKEESKGRKKKQKKKKVTGERGGG